MAEKRGAKSKCTPELIQEAYKYSALGLLDKDIQVLLDIGNDSFYRYIKESSDFSDAIKKGRIKGKALNLENIQDASTGSKEVTCPHCKKEHTVRIPHKWTAGAWLLERRYPQEFGQKVDIKHEGEVSLKATITGMNGNGNGKSED